MNIADLRIEYSRETLDEASVARDPYVQFDAWFAEAVKAQVREPNAMTLATVGADGRPAARIVLLKGVDARGFSFFTNYESRKGRELAAHPAAALLLFWPDLERQVRIEGRVMPLPVEESASYFATRPRSSQIGAWASPQSEPVAGRRELEARFAAFEQRHASAADPEQGPIPRPPHWGGYRLEPDLFEFWQGRASRLHDRIRYRRAVQAPSAPWVVDRLAP